MSDLQLAGKAFLDSLFGKANYCRWLLLKERLNIETDEGFVHWLLDTAESIIDNKQDDNYKDYSSIKEEDNNVNNDESVNTIELTDEDYKDSIYDSTRDIVEQENQECLKVINASNNTSHTFSESRESQREDIHDFLRQEGDRSSIPEKTIDISTVAIVKSEKTHSDIKLHSGNSTDMDQRQFTANAAKFFYNSAAAAASMQACSPFNLPQSHDMMYSSLGLQAGVMPSRTVNSTSSQQMPSISQQNSFLSPAHATSPFSGVSQNQIMQQFPHAAAAAAQSTFSYPSTSGMLGGAFSSFLPQQGMAAAAACQDMSLHHQVHQHQLQTQPSPTESSSTASSPGVNAAAAATAGVIDGHIHPLNMTSAAPPINCMNAASGGLPQQPQQQQPPVAQSQQQALSLGRAMDAAVRDGVISPASSTSSARRSAGAAGAVGNSDKYQCHICSKTFCHKNYLTIHIRKHTGERPFACHYCQRRFSIKDYLQKHLRTHTGEKPYACHICSRRFGQKSALNTHVRIHTGEKPYFCTICQMKFTQRTSLKNHVKVRHPDQAQSV